MIAYVDGTILEELVNGCIILTRGGIGYEVFLPSHTLVRLPKNGENICVYTHFVVREDAQELYGFETWDERSTFQVLISISKIGAKTAMGILSLFRPDDLRHIALEGDYTSLTQVSGIGKKTAQHVFLELKYKLKGNITISNASNTTNTFGASANSVFRDVLDGLSNLGYAEEEVIPAIKKILTDEPDLDVSSALRKALRALAKGIKD